MTELYQEHQYMMIEIREHQMYQTLLSEALSKELDFELELREEAIQAINNNCAK